MAVFTALSIAVATYGVSAGLAGAAMAGLGYLATTFTGQLLLSLGVNALLGALSPKPAAAAQRGYETNVLGAALDHTIIYGKTKVGGAVVYNEATGTDNKFLHRVITVAGHEVESFERIYINDAYIDFSNLGASGNVPTVFDPDGTTSDRYNDKLRIQVAYGTPTQEANADLVTASDGKWTNSCKLSGIAYIYVRLAFDADVYPNGIPTFTAEIKGKKVYDPRTNTTGWSDNPALCVRDYLTSTGYGLGEIADNIDDDLTKAAADVCDQTVFGKTRYTTNGSFTTGATPYDLISSILPSMGGSLWYAQGKWRVKPAYWTAPVMFLDEDDLRSSISVSTRHSRRDNFNVIKGKFSGPDTNWQMVDYKEVKNESAAGTFVVGLPYSISEVGTTNFVAIGASSNTVGEVFVATGAGTGTGVADLNLGVDNGLASVADVDLLFTDNMKEARRLGRITLERNRQQLTIQASFGLKTLGLQVGDNVYITNNRFGWTNKAFEILSWNFGLTDGLDLQTEMTLRETAEAAFDEVDDAAIYEADNTNLPSPFFVPVPSLDAAVITTTINEDGTAIPAIDFSWSVSNSEVVDYYDFQWKLTGASNYSSIATEEPRFTLAPALSNVSYNYRVRAVNTLGIKSQYASSPSPANTGDDTTIPNAPTGLSASAGYGAVTVTWTAPTTNVGGSPLKDLFQYEIYRGTSSNPTVKVGRVAGEIFTDGGLSDNTTYYYRVKAVDFTGNSSAYSTQGSATTNPTLVDGTDGLNNATVFLYNKSSSATPPALFSGTFLYTFSTGVLSGGTLNGWSQEPPTLSQGDNLWVSLATASSRTATDSIPTAEFSTPEITGVAGTDGANTARVSLFRKTTTTTAPADPSGTFTYTFATGVLSGGTFNSWSQSAPSINNGEYLWVIQASAFSSNATDTIAASEFTPAAIVGIGGTNGNPAKLLVLNATDQVFTFDENNVADPTSQTITFTAFLENTDDTTATWSSNPSVTLTGTGNTRSLSVANFGANTSVTITASADSGAVSDTFTVYRLKEGATGAAGEDALTLILSNEAHTFAADAAGVVASYSGSGTTIKLFEGTTELIYQQSSTLNSRWAISASPSNITVGSITDSGNFATVNNHSNMTQDTASIVYTITGKRADGSAINLTKTQSFSKSKVGAAGETGASTNVIFIRSATQPATPAPSSGIPSGWYDSPPAGTELVWASSGVKVVGSTTFTWGTPWQIDGASIAEVSIYRKNSSAGGTGGSYNFVTQTLTPPTSWSVNPPALTANGDTIYRKSGVASGSATQTSATVSYGTAVVYANRTDGTDGARGAGRWNIGVTTLPTTSSGANTAFVAAIGQPVDRDQAWFYTGTQSAPTSQSVWIYNAGTLTWVEQTEVIDGNLLVTGTVTANAIDADAITGKNVKVGDLVTNGTAVPTSGSGALMTSAGDFTFGNTAEYVAWDSSAGLLTIQGVVRNINELAFNGHSGEWLEVTTATANFSLTSDMNFLGGKGVFVFMMAGGGGGGGGQNTGFASGGGAAGFANFVYDWDGSTTLTFPRGTGGAGGMANTSSTIAPGFAGSSSLFKIGGTTRVTCSGGGGGGSGNIGTPSFGGAGGTVTYSSASTYFPLYSRSVTGGRGGNAGISSSAAGGGGIDCFNLGRDNSGGDTTTQLSAKNGGSVFGNGNATRYYRSSADYPFGSFLSVDWVNNGRDESAFRGGVGVASSNTSGSVGGTGGIFAGGGGAKWSGNDPERSAQGGAGGHGGGGGGADAVAGNGLGRGGVGGNGVLYIARL
jgi:hypothetical protein